MASADTVRSERRMDKGTGLRVPDRAGGSQRARDAQGVYGHQQLGGFKPSSWRLLPDENVRHA